MNHEPPPSEGEQPAPDVNASVLVAKAAIVMALRAAGQQAIAHRNTDEERAVARQSVIDLAAHLQDCVKICLDIHQTLTEAQESFDDESAKGVN